MKFLIVINTFVLIQTTLSCKCYKSYEETFGVKVEERVISERPHAYLKASDLPDSFDWRNVNGTSYVSRVLTQQNPAVCGSCWAEGATGALSDRYLIATGGKLQIQLAPQVLLNYYSELTGGDCEGGDSSKAYEFMFKYGITDDTCAPFLGVNAAHGFEVAGKKKVTAVQDTMCYICDWNGACGFVPRKYYNLYHVDEYGSALGEEEMMAEIYARGPISCSLNSEPDVFNDYHGGIISCANSTDIKCKYEYTDHVLVIAGWGVDSVTGTKYWIGRNSYGTRWGEGAGGGWFRLERGVNALNMESHHCYWGTPAAADVQAVLDQYNASL